MTLRFRAVSLRATTGQGPVGFDLQFAEGLTVLRAPNNSGKSTVLQALVYGLGLEGMFNSSHEVPLPHAMTERVEVNGEDVPVIQSHVTIEIANGKGDIVTVQRAVLDPVLSQSLVGVWAGPLLTNPSAGPYDRTDYFVRRAGAAQHDFGFHHFLAEFVGWDLPEVPHYDGTETPLYIEALFPLLYIEQKFGWGGIKPRMPTYLGIVDVGRRAIEYLTGLSTLDRARRRAELEDQLTQIANEWSELLVRLTGAAEREGANVVGTPKKPTTWTDAVQPVAEFFLGEDTVSLDGMVERVAAELAEVPLEPMIALDADQQANEELVQRQEELRRLIGQARAVEEALDLSENELAVLDRRIAAVTEDRQRLVDVRTLQSLGSTLAIDALAAHDCPTCHQNLGAIEVADGQTPLALDDNVHLLEQRLRALRDMRDATGTNTDGLTRALASAQQRAGALRLRIRALKSSLVLPGSMPNVAAIERRLTLERRLQDLETLRSVVDEVRIGLERLAGRADQVRARLKELTKDLTLEDQRRLAQLQVSLRDQLRLYGFGSLPVDEIGISRQTLQPSHEGIDLEFDLSASDAVRTKWSWFVALLELGSVEPTNHPGVLVLDEPGQQEISPESVDALFRRLQTVAGSHQVIVATSASEERLREVIGDDAPGLRAVSDKLLVPLQERSG